MDPQQLGCSAAVSTSPRRVAFEVLTAVHVDDAYANLELPTAISWAKLSNRDAAFATELTYGVLRKQGSVDAVIAACSDRPKIDQPVQDVLRIGAYQLLFMRTPTHAAVDESVSLARTVVGQSVTSFVNAVLRKVAQHSWTEWVEILAKDAAPVDRLALEYSYPVWVIRTLADAYQCDATTVQPILQAGNEPAHVTLIARPGQCTVDELLAVPHVAPGNWSPLAAHIVRPTTDDETWSTNPGDIELVRSGRVGVQDEGSQLVALALTNAQVEGDEHNWLDMCAGPGGKAAILAGVAASRSIALTALEPIASRATLVEQSLEHAPGQHEVIVTDARTFTADHQFDRILIDAPCTGLGALRRRPESRWRKQPSDIPELTTLQGQLLDQASELVRIGGVVCYATCSPHIAETDAVVDAFIKRHPSFATIDVSATVPSLNLPENTHRVRLRPDIHGTDGMYFVLLRRNS